MNKCSACGRILLVPLPWCPECGNSIKAETSVPVESLTGEWVKVMECRRPVGPTVLALLEREGIPCKALGRGEMGAAGASLFPEICVRPKDLAIARNILKTAGLLEWEDQ